jgi:serine protease AprX
VTAPDAGAPSSAGLPEGVRPNVRETLSEALRDPGERARMGIDTDEDVPVPIMVELNIAHPGGLEAARARLLELVAGERPPLDAPRAVSGSLYTARLSVADSRRLVAADAQEPDRRRRAIYRIWPDFPVRPLVVR